MKRRLLIIAAALSGLGALAQSTVRNEKGFLIFSVGPSIPVGVYASTDVNSPEAGAAATGFNTSLHFGYALNKFYSVAATAFYTKHGIDDAALGGTITADSWRYWGVTVGPMYTFPVSHKVKADLSVMTGVASVRLPKLTTREGATTNVKWQATVPVTAALNVRLQVARTVQVLGGVNYLYMQPNFGDVYGTGTSIKQKINVLGINAGIGFTF